MLPELSEEERSNDKNLREKASAAYGFYWDIGAAGLKLVSPPYWSKAAAENSISRLRSCLRTPVIVRLWELSPTNLDRLVWEGEVGPDFDS